MALSTDKHLKIEKVGKVYRATYDGVTICSCATKRGTEINAEYLMNNLQPAVWAALVKRAA